MLRAADVHLKKLPTSAPAEAIHTPDVNHGAHTATGMSSAARIAQITNNNPDAVPKQTVCLFGSAAKQPYTGAPGKELAHDISSNEPRATRDEKLLRANH